MDHHIRDILKQFVKQDALSEGYQLQKIRSFWESKMGSSISNRTVGISLKSGTVKIRVNSAPLKNDLFNSRDRIKQMINDHLGEDVVSKVIIT